ncbi:MAG: hypothetical protein IIU90_02980, partial [Bacteroidaceae bacterium]|nr:hypothetical protein [Bacteroidaceae bacterium]
HHRQCDDIGTVKIPKWVRNYTGKNPEFVFCSGTEFPEGLSDFKLVLHCGGCMQNEREMRYKLPDICSVRFFHIISCRAAILY